MEENLVPKAEAGYRVAQEGESTCASCANFIAPDACKLLAGTISENGVCDLFSPMENVDIDTVLFGGSNG
jgi:hypothetical protein